MSKAAVLLCVLTLVAGSRSTGSAAALGTAITYQGRLSAGASPANGTYDFRFAVYDGATNGQQFGGAVTNTGTQVSVGLFTSVLDFGQGVFGGESRWLEIAVRTNGASAFTVLAPRQPLTPAPSALYAPNAGIALTADTADLAAGVATNSVTAAGIAPQQVVKSLNGLSDAVTLAAGANVSLGTNGGTLTINAAPGSGGANPMVIQVYTNGTVRGPGGTINTAGSTTAGIQEAIDALPKVTSFGPASGGGKIVLQAGTYNCSGQVIIPHEFPFDLWIEGQGPGNTLLVYSGTTNFVQSVCVSNSSNEPLNFQLKNLGFAYVHDTNLACLVYLTNGVNSIRVENCLFTTYQSLRPFGHAGGISLNFEAGAPTNAVGVIGFRANFRVSNKTTFDRCWFYGLADGLVIGGDRTTLRDLTFACIGHYWTNGPEGLPTRGTAWNRTNDPGSLRSLYTNVFAAGVGLVADYSLSDMNVDHCFWFECGMAIVSLMNNTTSPGPIVNVTGAVLETTEYGYFGILDETGDDAACFNILTTGGRQPLLAKFGTIDATTGAIGTKLVDSYMVENTFPFSLKFNGTDMAGIVPDTGNLTVSGGLSANTFWGSGAGLTQVVATAVSGTITNLLYASNVVAGGTLPAGTVEHNGMASGLPLVTDGAVRVWSNHIGARMVFDRAVTMSDALTVTGAQTNLSLIQAGGFYNVASPNAGPAPAGPSPLGLWGSMMMTNTQSILLAAAGTACALTNYDVIYTNGFNGVLAGGKLINTTAGWYRVGFSTSVAASNDPVEACLAINGSRDGRIAARAAASPDGACLNASGILYLPANTVVSLLLMDLNAGTSNVTATVWHAMLSVGTP
jgi:hypothetical protein